MWFTISALQTSCDNSLFSHTGTEHRSAHNSLSLVSVSFTLDLLLSDRSGSASDPCGERGTTLSQLFFQFCLSFQLRKWIWPRYRGMNHILGTSTKKKRGPPHSGKAAYWKQDLGGSELVLFWPPQYFEHMTKKQSLSFSPVLISPGQSVCPWNL